MTVRKCAVQWPLKRGSTLRDDAFAQNGCLLAQWPNAAGDDFVKAGKQNDADHELLAIGLAANEKNARRSTIVPWLVDRFTKWRAIRRAAHLQRVDRIIDKGLSAVE
ncbi:MAG TPA: hypothetical protein VNK52_06795 [Hyphomicrobiaceae bacterium]|nr:hypothetical protein [Hyphomicrobiaceae bacterium]